MGEILIGLVKFLLGIAMSVFFIPFGVASLVVCFILVGLVFGIGLPIAIALGLLALPVYALYALYELVS